MDSCDIVLVATRGDGETSDVHAYRGPPTTLSVSVKCAVYPSVNNARQRKVPVQLKVWIADYSPSYSTLLYLLRDATRPDWPVLSYPVLTRHSSLAVRRSPPLPRDKR
ncbi:hypothetical protein CFE70_009467 [Pyrenophora teres f. teres 0-1]